MKRTVEKEEDEASFYSEASPRFARRLKGEVEELRKEQSNIREGQWQVRQKLKAIETECEALHEESKVMVQKSARTQIRLALMFNILRAREEGDLVKAARFTHLLREIIAKDNMQQHALRNN
ncbi:hypothetical protein V6N13_141262 [Hibiscus sabdariffa]|uniref:Uncharacterized protein n=1 Tax=Hibiscus sabdariffa TaxID=183260 RepID=A0ABR2Q0D3_9ROSI